MGPQMIGEIRTYRPIPPLRVWRVRRRWAVARWAWQCRLCRRESNGWNGPGHTVYLTWEAALATGIEHMACSHACPSMRASGEPCNEYCTDCGGRMWIY